MTPEDKMARIDEYLAHTGGLYTVHDILDQLAAGHMQSFTNGESMVVTTIQVYPRRRVLEIVMAFGEFPDLAETEPQIEEFAKSVGCTLIRAVGRFGWEAKMTDGWKRIHSVYSKEI